MQQGILKKTPNTELSSFSVQAINSFIPWVVSYKSPLSKSDKNVCAEYNMSTTTFKN